MEKSNCTNVSRINSRVFETYTIHNYYMIVMKWTGIGLSSIGNRSCPMNHVSSSIIDGRMRKYGPTFMRKPRGMFWVLKFVRNIVRIAQYTYFADGVSQWWWLLPSRQLVFELCRIGFALVAPTITRSETNWTLVGWSLISQQEAGPTIIKSHTTRQCFSSGKVSDSSYNLSTSRGINDNKNRFSIEGKMWLDDILIEWS